jgi:hypothetical protein
MDDTRGVSTKTLRTVASMAALAGLATLALSIAFARLPEVGAARQACGDAPPSLVRFQLALTISEVEDALGPAGECRDAAVAAMNAVNRLDVRAYIATYGAFVLLSLWVVMTEARRRGFWLVAAVVATALFADVVETTRQLAITADLADGARHLPLLIVASRVKFIGIGIAVLAASWAGWHNQPRRLLLAISCLPVVGLLPVALLAPNAYGDLAPLSLGIAWLVLLGSVSRTALRAAADR